MADFKDGDIVARGIVEVDYVIRAYHMDDTELAPEGVAYDYISGPVESDEWYPSLEDATRAAKEALDY